MITNKSDCWSKQNHEQILKQTHKHLWRFIQKNAKIASADDIFSNLTNVPKKDLQLLSSIYFLLSEDVKMFIEETAPAILNRLSKVSVNEHNILRGNVRGKINWNRTFKERYSAGGDPSIFVCSQRSSLFDLPENRLLLYLLRKILYISNLISNYDFKKGAMEYVPLGVKDKWIDEVIIIGIKATKLLKNPFVRNISEIHEINNKIISTAEKARGNMYSQLASAARTYKTMITSPISYLELELNGKTLEPINKDTLYEIAVLFKLFEVIEENGWIGERIGLIGGKSSIVSKYKLGQRRMKIYYQSIPRIFMINSKYGPLMSKYGLSDRFRRPDIILEIKENDITNYYIIEVKRSDKRAYLVDGAYKVFGYLKDFESVQDNYTNLHGVLVGWSNISDQSSFSQNEVLISSWENCGNAFDFIIKNL
ncbi:hypothetical protein SAMN05421676_10218 [Salinibacillus kushneri]|uniref:Uncharacterized protein n=1 Tax=Salinibacillus kushneri TaxID=237682 RepID=A0A1I0A3K3_9BACI|nr:hypothetical protein [Salinibacillus kushneri]SES88556.1 hypothetical protein SAMN05421676_10218 [Salinibacillus kushneri]